MTDNDNALYVVRPGPRTLIAGLRWELVDGRRRSAARRAARSRDADRFAVVPAGKSQLLTGSGNLTECGITAREAKNSFSLALSVLPLLGSHGWGIFALDDGRYWFIATQEGQLSVLSDVIGNHDTVRQALDTFLSFDTFTADDRTIFCPAGFLPDVNGTDQTLDVLLSKLAVPRFARLHPVSNRLALITWSALLVVIFGGYFGVTQYQSHLETQRIAAARAAYLKAKEQIKSATPAALQPWKAQPVLTDFLTQCSQQWKIAPLSIAGWRFNTADCSQEGIRLAWSKPSGGTIGDFSRRLALWYPGLTPLFNIPGGADTGGVSVALHMPLPDAPETVASVDSQTQRLTNYAQQLRARLNLTEDGALSTRVDGQVIPLPWRSFSFTFTTDIPPDRLFAPAQFDASGVRLTRITVSLSNARLHYSLEGKLYAQR
ncbi:type 4b pilus protein PilO2 (plasmid) [Erwinia tracheiphila]|uniref:Pilus assembly protein n=1 Tax=Erwinia tracheiphila TaxID=65700 RepID=A0A345CZX3_9GAMM|nr:type 4b pilus protein PilO2 [Erwinia tracheiphila]AXF78990.1 hypothetical protein AV903_26390 [Erwinia tracheiphila]UIA85889.1 type 4b pilus protein PilO2 [Erwinia tracheiphila]UIA94410.1 type 4b pilus protein PilO2 [Erwinia tracheiphila]